MLGMPEARVRELARDALLELAPLSGRGVEEDWRGQLADYVLGQQSGPEATATRGHLRRSEAARTWARSLMDSLEQLYATARCPRSPRGSARGRTRKRRGGLGPPRLAGVDVAQARGACWQPAAPSPLVALDRRAAVADRRAHRRRRRRQLGVAAPPPRPPPAANPAGAAVILGQGDQRAVRSRPPASAQHAQERLRGLALRRPAQRQVAGCPGHRQEGHLRAPSDPARRLREATATSTSRARGRRQRRPLGRFRPARPHAEDRQREGQEGHAARPGRAEPSPRTDAQAGSSLPGFMIPAGSSGCLAARSTSIPRPPTSAAIQGAWSRPTAWWCVIVPPLATIASQAAPFAARHCSSGSRSPGGR